jgi:hypothetical protein
MAQWTVLDQIDGGYVPFRDVSVHVSSFKTLGLQRRTDHDVMH